MSPDMSYETGILVEAGTRQSGVAAASTEVRTAVTGHGVDLEMIGDVPAAAGFHRALISVVTRQAADADAESARRADLAARAGRSAGLGDGLTVATAELARSAAAPAAPGSGLR